jgi:hypothetical protein
MLVWTIYRRADANLHKIRLDKIEEQQVDMLQFSRYPARELIGVLLGHVIRGNYFEPSSVGPGEVKKICPNSQRLANMSSGWRVRSDRRRGVSTLLPKIGHDDGGTMPDMSESTFGMDYERMAQITFEIASLNELLDFHI